MIPKVYNQERVLEILNVMKRSSARVVVVFAVEGELALLLKDYMEQNITGIQWIASEAWVTASLFSGREFYPFLGGTIGYALQQGQQQHPGLLPAAPLCRAGALLEQHSAYLNTSNPSNSFNAYKAVYAIAHSLQNLISCKPGKGPFHNSSCADVSNIQPWQVIT
ncbi:hypothetical protein SKAU_G00077910 [Synaphobranchus kaupii]|uniref:Receptor ligand binding region domain-containing protein n=1 Tax=Synaphobranchus kaupii TaxID=118154 RepID=A0A9Q1FU24_SYNKA|nr:hypothetical protein SKAU_G00077910 [Synaphobranchus kaupii]